MALDQYKTQVLLLHSQQSTLDSLSTGFGDKLFRACGNQRHGSPEYLQRYAGAHHRICAGPAGHERPRRVARSAQALPGNDRHPARAGSDQDDGLEALVGEEEVFQIVRGEIAPEALCALVESATQRARLMAIAQSANDTTAAGDERLPNTS